MPKYTQEELREKYNKLPEELKDAIFSEDVARVIRDISQKYKLPIDKMGELGSEIGYVFLGITHPHDFVGNLVQRLRTDQLTTRNIAEDVNREIFSPVRESLKNLYGEEKEEGAPGTPEGGPVAPPQTAFSDAMPLAALGTISPETQSHSGAVPARPEPEQRPQGAPVVPSGSAQDRTPPPPHEQKSADLKTAYPPPAPPLPFRQKEGAPLQKPAAPATAQGLDTSSEIVRAESKISEHKLPLSPEEQKRIKRKAFEQLFSEHKADGQEITTPAQSQNTRKENDPYREPVE